MADMGEDGKKCVSVLDLSDNGYRMAFRLVVHKFYYNVPLQVQSLSAHSHTVM